jgi:hypothetical protein
LIDLWFSRLDFIFDHAVLSRFKEILAPQNADCRVSILADKDSKGIPHPPILPGAPRVLIKCSSNIIPVLTCHTHSVRYKNLQEQGFVPGKTLWA